MENKACQSKKDGVKFIGPTKSQIPNDIGLSLNYPLSIKNTEQKIIYALWREGAQSFSNLIFLTRLNSNTLSSILEKLVAISVIQKLVKSLPNREGKTTSLYKLNHQ